MSKMSIDGVPDVQLKRFRVTGATMGTRYSATFHASPNTDERELAAQLAAAVGAVDEQMSNWKDSSDLSRLNRAEPNCWVPVSRNLAACSHVRWRLAAIRTTPSTSAWRLVGMWGFGPSGEQRAHRPAWHVAGEPMPVCERTD